MSTRTLCIRVAAVAAAALLTLTACSTDPGAEPGGASFWSLTGGVEPMVTGSVRDWNEANPDRPIQHELFAGDVYKERIRTAVGSGGAPTLIHSWGGGPLREYAQNGRVIDLGDAASRVLATVVPAIAANGEVDGVPYAVPYTHTSIVSFFYNRAVFDQAGAEVPTTLDELETAVERLRAAGVEVPISIAGGSRWPELMWIQYLTDRIGGPEVFRAVLDGQEGAWTDPAILRAAQEIAGLVEMGAFGSTFGSVLADQNADIALVHQGRAGMILHLSSAHPNFVTDAPAFVASGDLGYFPFPTVPGGTGDPANLVGNPSLFLSVSADGTPAAQQTALDFIATQVLDDDRIDDLLELGNVPPVLGIEDRIASLPDNDFMLFSYALLANAPHFQLSWDQALGGAQAQALLDNLSSLFLGQITPEDFVRAMDAGS